MKYDIQIDVEHKRPKILLNLRLDEELIRNFKYVAKQHGKSMTHILTKMLEEFVKEYREKGKAKQKEIF